MRAEILASARKHGIVDDDIWHALSNCLAWVEIGDDPYRYLLAGPDRSGNMLELVAIAGREGDVVIHAMRLRTSTSATLFGSES